MNLSVIIPCYNEVNSITKVVQSVLDATNSECEIIIVDDCSTDGTKQLLAETIEGKLARVIYQSENQGKGAALRKGFAAATKDIVIVQDADFEYDPSDYALMIGPILKDQADVVYGSRFKGNRPQRVLYFWHRVGNGLLTLMSNMFTNLNLTDMETGYKVFKREVVDDMTLHSKRFEFEPEFTAKILKRKYRIFEVPITFNPRDYSDGKKIGLSDAFEAIWALIKYRFVD